MFNQQVSFSVFLSSDSIFDMVCHRYIVSSMLQKFCIKKKWKISVIFKRYAEFSNSIELTN